MEWKEEYLGEPINPDADYEPDRPIDDEPTYVVDSGGPIVVLGPGEDDGYNRFEGIPEDEEDDLPFDDDDEDEDEIFDAYDPIFDEYDDEDYWEGEFDAGEE